MNLKEIPNTTVYRVKLYLFNPCWKFNSLKPYLTYTIGIVYFFFKKKIFSSEISTKTLLVFNPKYPCNPRINNVFPISLILHKTQTKHKEISNNT